MVAKFVSGNSIRGILRYNEEKVTEGDAKLIMASGFATDIDKLNFHQRLYRFEMLNQLRPSVKSNAVHITLNFHEDDELGQTKLQQIVAEYMERLGFGEQPYIAYQHLDTNHPHIHIATNRIDRKGEAINVNKIGYRLSEPARKEIEVKFNLIKAEGREFGNDKYLKPAEYGARPTKKQLHSITQAVMRDYCYTSFAEYKAVLAQFNVHVDRGEEGTSMFEKRGILYSITDLKGDLVGVPFKASSFYNGATMDKLEKNFDRNKEKRTVYKQNLKDRIDAVLDRFHTVNRDTLIKELASEQVAMVLRRNENGLIYGLTYVDHKNKTVFNGSDLGKDYSAKALIEHLSEKDVTKQYLGKEQSSNMLGGAIDLNNVRNNEETILNQLLAKPDYDGPTVIGKKRKKRHGKGQSQNHNL